MTSVFQCFTLYSICIIPASIGVALYGFGDASGTGFGQTFATPTGTMFCYGVYGKDKSKLSSNYHKLSNLVSALEQGSADGTFNNAEVWILTDSPMVEAVFCKGHFYLVKVWTSWLCTFKS